MNVKTKTFKRIVLLLIIIGLNIPIYPLSQNIEEVQQQSDPITGVIIDGETNESILGANVIVKNKPIGTASDFDGKYAIQAEPGDVLIFSFLGYETREVIVKKTDKIIDIKLYPAKEFLEEVIVVGYNEKQVKDVTESVVKIKNAESLNTRPIINAQEILQGNASGVTVLNDGGDPVKTPLVKIRGVGTLGRERPLLVVDGVPELPMPNPSNIESITVLKDASASVYGARASGGVILVTTKKGKKDKTQINFNVYTGFQSVSHKLKPLTVQEYIDVRKKTFENSGVYDNEQVDFLKNLQSNINTLPNNNWIDMIFRNGMIENYDLSITGGGKLSKFYTGLNYKKTEGILLNSYAENMTLRLNSEYNVKENYFTVGENLAITHTNGNYGINTTNTHKGAIFSAISTRSFHPLKEADGTYTRGDSDLINPVAYLMNKDDKRPTINLAGNIFAKYHFLSNFTLKSSLGINKTLGTVREYKSADRKDATRFLYRKSVDYFSYVIENTIAYKNIFNRHALDLLVGHSAQKNEGYDFSALARNFPLVGDELQYLDTPVNDQDRILKGGLRERNSLISLVGRLDYSFDRRYYVTAIVRRDGSSKLAPSQRWGTFPSFLIAWKPSNEVFMKESRWISDLKLRGSYGRLGNVYPLGDFDYLPDVRIGGGDFTIIDGKLVDGINYKKPANPNLKWEESVQVNVGLDGSLFKNSLYFTFDYFIKTTENMLIQSPIASQKGFQEPPFTNSAEVENKGFEFLLGYKKAKENIGFDISANASLIKNEVKKLNLGENKKYIYHSENIRGLKPLRTVVGQPIRSYFVIPTAGIFQTQEQIDNYTNSKGEKLQPEAKPGDLIFVDANQDGEIDKRNDTDKVFKGSAFPDVTFGLNFNVNYKGLQFSMLWQGVLGNKVFNGLKYTSYRPFDQGYNMVSEAKNAWSPTNKSSNIPRLVTSEKDNNKNYATLSDWYLEDASYARLKNITISYNLPTTTFKTKLNAKVYLTGKNLFTITKYKGFDPEVSPTGIDVGYYPTARSFILGANLQF